jgi:hypothetical protein
MKISKNLSVIALALVATASQAAAVDVTATVADIASQAAPIALVAGAVLAIHLGVKAFKWIRQAMA